MQTRIGMVCLLLTTDNSWLVNKMGLSQKDRDFLLDKIDALMMERIESISEFQGLTPAESTMKALREIL